VCLKLKRSGLAESTVKNVSNQLLHLARYCDLDVPEQVKGFIADKNVENSYNHSLVKCYNYYVTTQGLEWDKPKFRSERKIPKVPTTETVREIIQRCGPKYTVIFTLLAEVGAMPHELYKLVLERDVDYERGALIIQGRKGHAGRIVKLKPRTLAKLKFYFGKIQGFSKTEFNGSELEKS
jgi:integrase